MLYRIARFMQLAGLILLPIAIAGNLQEVAGGENKLTLWQSLTLSGIGVSVFTVGWLIQQKFPPPK